VGDFKISKNGGAPAALDGSATLTHRNTGHYSLALTANDLDTVGQAEVVIDDTTNACPMKELTVIEEAVYDALWAASATGLLPANVTQISGDGTAADTLELFAEALDQSTGQIDSGSFAAGAITAAAIADAAIDAATFAADVDAEILSYLVDDATRLDASALNTHAAITVAAIADQVWEEAIADHSGTAGSTAEQLSAAGAAGDPWATALPGAYSAGQAGKIVGDNLNATVSSRSSHSAADVWAAATRTLTALDEDSTAIDLDAAIRAAVGLASANLDTQLGTIDSEVGVIDGIVDAIVADTNELQTDWANGGRLDLLIDAILEDTGTTLPATLSTIAGYLDAEIAAILEDTGTTLPAQIAALNNLSAAQVNAEVVDCLNVDAYTIPSQGSPGTSVSIVTALGYLFKAFRNKCEQTSTAYILYADNGSTVDQRASCSDDGSVFTRSKVETGP
jgi:hypothetical protein